MNRTESPLPLINLSTQQLSYLVAVAHAPTFAAAAADLHVSVSALSQGLSELERRIGVELFERVGRRQVLRAELSEVLGYAERTLAQTRDLARWIDQRQSGRIGRLRVGMIDVAAVHHYPDALRTFRRRFRDVELRLTVAPSGTLVEQLLTGALDIVVCVRPEPLPVDLVSTRLRRESLAVYAPPRASDGGPSTWGPWVTFPEGSQTRVIISRALAKVGATFEVVAESHQPEVLREMVHLGLGWTVLPVVQAEAPPAPLRRARRASIATRELVALRRTAVPDHPIADALLEVLTTR